MHHNIPQLEYLLTQANLTVAIMGRGAGKSKPLASFLKNCCEKMPRSVIRFSTYTYEGMLKNVLPGVAKSWESDYGYKEGIHFWLRAWPDKDLNIPKPRFCPVIAGKYIVSWWNGSIIVLTSMERSMNNGADFDAGAFDEARLYPHERVTELLRAKRGNTEFFGHLPEHGSLMFTSDRPWDAEGNWLLDYKALQDDEVINAIQQASIRIEQLLQQMDELQEKLNERAANDGVDIADLQNSKEATKLDELRSVCRRLTAARDELRKNAVHFIEASTLENVHALGLKYLIDTRRDSTQFEWETAILNLPPSGVLDGFYAKLSRKHHGYYAQNYEVMSELKYNADRELIGVDWRSYDDYDQSSALHVACDHNNAINWMVTAQPFPQENKVRFQNAQFVESPKYIKELVDQWAAFYRNYPSNRVYYYFDNTNVDANSRGDKNEADTVMDRLRHHGWQVIPVYIGQAPYHSARYLLWDHSLSGHEGLLRPEFNMSTCDDLLIGMKNAPAKPKGRSFEKDKSSERKNYKTGKYKVRPVHATHGSEAADILLTGINRNRFADEQSFLDTIYG